MKKFRLSAMLAAGAMLLVAACGGGAPDSDTKGDSEAEFDPNGSLVYAGQWAIDTWDPPRTLVSQFNEPLFLAYDRLVHVDTEGQPIPGLATSWEFSDNNKTLTFHLREGVKFTDGEVFDAEAVKANIERARDLPDSQVGSGLASVKEVIVDSPTQVTFKMDEPSPQLPLVLSERTSAMASPAAFANDGEALKMDSYGTGMYKVEEFIPGDRVVYVRNDDHWDKGAAKLARFEFRSMSDTQTRLNALRSGEVDWAVLDPRDYQTIKNDSNFDVEVVKSLVFRPVTFNISGPALTDERVRQALNYGLDREAISKVLTAGLAEPCAQPFPPGYPAHNEEVGCDPYPYDPDKARSLLEEAGWADGKFRPEILALPSFSTDIAEVLQAQWKNIGVEATIRVDAAAAELWNSGRAGDMLPGVWGGRNSPFETLFSQFHSTGPFNEAQYEDPEVDAAYAAALNAPDEESQNQALRDMVKMVTDKALNISLYFDPVVSAWDKKVLGAETYLTKQEFRGVGVAASR